MSDKKEQALKLLNSWISERLSAFSVINFPQLDKIKFFLKQEEYEATAKYCRQKWTKIHQALYSYAPSVLHNELDHLTIFCIFEFYANVKQNKWNCESLDMALIITNGCTEEADLIQYLINACIPENNFAQPVSLLNCENQFVLETDFRRAKPLKVCVEFAHSSKPYLLRSAEIAAWPAFEIWKNMNYWLIKYGHRTVPVEIGKKYTDDEWRIQPMRISSFINDYLINLDNDEIVYLAQHNLFDQITELKNDFSIPTFLDDCIVNCWWGKGGTVTPLHTDPYSNVYVQIFGYKRVILYAPKYSDRLYPRLDNLKNTSQIDFQHAIDTTKFPMAVELPFYEIILGPGDVLYIPIGWWHYMESGSVSMSVSFWHSQPLL